MNSRFYIGVDGGGTKTHAVLFDYNLAQIDEAYSGAANIATDVDMAYSSICTVVDILVSKYKLLVSQVRIGIGVAGYSVIQNRQILLTRLQEKYVDIILNSDCHIACLAAHSNRNGAVVICGTGVVAYSIYDGEYKQLGGWGFPQGDLGGAAYLGLETARKLCKAIDGVAPWNASLKALFTEFFDEDSYKCKMWLINAAPGDYAKITQFIFLKPADEFCQTLLECGVNEIKQLIMALQKDKPSLAIKLVGGLARLYIDILKKNFPSLELSEIFPAFGAALLCYG